MDEYSKNVAVAGAVRIVDDYVREVVRTGLFLGDSNLIASKELLEQALWALLGKTINEIELRYDPNFSEIVSISQLQSYVDAIPNEAFQSLGHYRSGNLDSLQEIFDRMAKNIKDMMPFYKGFKYETPWMLGLFSWG